MLAVILFQILVIRVCTCMHVCYSGAVDTESGAYLEQDSHDDLHYTREIHKLVERKLRVQGDATQACKKVEHSHTKREGYILMPTSMKLEYSHTKRENDIY